MDDYTREMMDLKTLVTRTLEKKGVLAKIRVIFSIFLFIFLIFHHAFVSTLLVSLNIQICVFIA